VPAGIGSLFAANQLPAWQVLQPTVTSFFTKKSAPEAQGTTETDIGKPHLNAFQLSAAHY